MHYTLPNIFPSFNFTLHTKSPASPKFCGIVLCYTFICCCHTEEDALQKSDGIIIVHYMHKKDWNVPFPQGSIWCWRATICTWRAIEIVAVVYIHTYIYIYIYTYMYIYMLITASFLHHWIYQHKKRIMLYSVYGIYCHCDLTHCVCAWSGLNVLLYFTFANS